jgi:WD40 repeat protein
MWVTQSGDNLTTTVMALTTLDGAKVAGTIPVPLESSGFDAVADGAGYLLFSGIGGLYDSRPDGLHRISTGALLAVGPTGWLVLECNEQHHCHPVLVGRVDGSRRVVTAPIDRVGRGVLSPDGSTAAMLTQDPDGTYRMYLVDLATGKRRVLEIPTDPTNDDGGFTFSPDGRWLFVLTSDRRLVVVNSRTTAVGSLGVPLPDLIQLAVRPAR